MKKIIYIIFGLIFFIFLIQDDYQYVESGQARIVYDPSAIDDNTLAMAYKYFENIGFFDNKVGDVVLIEQGLDNYIAVKFPVVKGSHTEARIIDSFRVLGAELQESAFGAKLFEIHLTDSQFDTLKVIR